MDDQAAREQVTRVEELLEELEGLPDVAAREKCVELVGTLLDLYGEGMARILAQVPDPEALTGDELVLHLLLLHGLHPVPVEERVHAALAEVRPYAESHGGDIQLVEIDDGVVRLLMRGSCSGCPSSSATLSLAVEEAIRKVAPEIDEIEAIDEEPTSLIQLQPLPAEGSTTAV